MVELVSLLLVGLGLLVAVLVVRALEAARWRQRLVAYRLRFPRGMQPAEVGAFVAGLSGLVAPWWSRAMAARAVVVETTASVTGITHHLLIAQGFTGLVLGSLRAALPGVRVDEDLEYRVARPNLAGELRLSNHRRPLRVDQPEAVSAALLAGLQPVDRGEAAVIQLTLAPVGPVGPVNPRRRGDHVLAHLERGITVHLQDAEAIRAARAKQALPLVQATVRIGVVAAAGRARQLLRRVSAAFHMVSAPGVHFRRRVVPSVWTARSLAAHALPLLRYRVLLNSAEVVALMTWPLGDRPVAGVELGGARQLPPPPGLPRQGRLIAVSNFPGSNRPLILARPAALRHLHVIGPTGVGKSTLLANLILSDVAAGYGVVVVDPKAGLVADVLDRIPARRMDDVILLDPTDDERPVGLNVLAGSAPELVVDQVVGVFHQLYRAFWGPRTQDILHAALLTLVTEPGMTLAEVPLILTDKGFRQRLIGRLDDYVLSGFWAWYEGLSEAERAQSIGPVQNKLRSFLLRRRIRMVIGQAEPAFSFEAAIATRRIVLVSLNKGQLGDEAAALLGSLMVARLWQAVQARAGKPASERPPVFAYVDELQDYLNLPTSIGDVLAQARGLGLGLTLAHQHLGQLPTAVRQAVLANCASRVIFQLAADDARVIARELTPYLAPADLQGLEPYEVVAQLATAAGVAAPATGTTQPLGPTTGTGGLARARSRQRYGQERGVVEAALRRRHEPRGSGPVGRRAS